MKQIKEFPNYSITIDGKVWNNKHKRWLKSVKNGQGYLRVTLYKDGKGFDRKICRLMLDTFICKCPDGMECCHNNGNKTDDRLGNLRWDTHSSNCCDTVKHGRCNLSKNKGEKNYSAKLTEQNVRTIIYIWRTNLFLQREIADMYNVSQARISSIVNKKDWKHLWEIE